MFEKALTLDGSKFKKTKEIKAKRPSEYWLLFFKKYVLKKQSRTIRKRHFLFLVPIILLIVVIYQSISDSNTVYIPGLIISIFASIFINIFAMHADKHAFVSTDSFNHLAKFIIDIKGDLYNSSIPLHLNFGTIESHKFNVSPSKFGLKNSKGVKYKAYQLQRYNAIFRLRDKSNITTSLQQVSVQVATTKRRSSGKVKTKYKNKHKLFYMLILKVKASDYELINTSKLGALQNKQGYTISIQTIDGMHIIKIKCKKKLLKIDTEISYSAKTYKSCFTKMLMFLTENKVITSTPSSALIS